MPGDWPKYNGCYQLPLEPPVLIGFLVVPTALAPGFAMNFEPCGPPLELLLPGLPAFLLLTGNDILFVFFVSNPALR